MDAALNPTLHHLLKLCRMDRTFVRGEGVYLIDAQGRRFLDCYSQYGAVALGHNAPCVVAAVHAALEEGEPALVQPYRAPHAVRLAALLTGLAPGPMADCVFTTSGAETVEAALKLVRARTGRPLILSAQGSFHGKTLGALALTGQTHYAEDFGPMPTGFERVPFGDASALAVRLASDGERIAAVFLEPIQGESGVHLPPPGYFAEVRRLCTHHGVALVLDEIQTGLGRTGRLFACEHEGIAPDLLLLAKALGGGLFPLGACLVAAAFWDERFALRHSSTFANNNVACRVGCAVLDALTRGGLCAEAARKGEILTARLAQLAQRFPGMVAAVRSRGLLAAIELKPVGPERGLFLSLLYHQSLYAYAVAATLAEDAGVLVAPTLGETPVLRFAPPLVMSDRELHQALDGVETVFGQLNRNAGATIARAIGAVAPREASASRIVLPPPVANQPAVGSTYAFLMHPTRPEDIALTNPGLERLTPAELDRFCTFLAEIPPALVLRAPAVHSPTGAVAQGYLICLPLLPRAMAERGLKRMSRAIAQAVDLAAQCGARVVGLGGHTTAFSRRGLAVLGRGPAVTTGNALTAGMAFAATCRLAEQCGLPLAKAAVAIVGARGSVGQLCARLFARAGVQSLLLVGNPDKGRAALESLRRELRSVIDRVEIATDLDDLADCEIVLTATGAGRPILDDAPLRPGTIVCDVARPPDASERLRARKDLHVIDGGLVALPDARLRFGAGNLQGMADGVQLACLSEAILLALEGDERDHSIGDRVPLSEVDAMMALARRHGFRLAPTTAPPPALILECPEAAELLDQPCGVFP